MYNESNHFKRIRKQERMTPTRSPTSSKQFPPTRLKMLLIHRWRVCLLETEALTTFPFDSLVCSVVSNPFATPWTVAPYRILQARILEGLPCCPPGDPPEILKGSNSHLLCLLHWQVGSLPLAPPGKLPI